MRHQIRISHYILAVVFAVSFVSVAKPVSADPIRLVQNSHQYTKSELKQAKENYRNVLLLMAFFLKPVEPENRLSRFYNLKMQFFDQQGLPAEIVDFDTTLNSDGSYLNPNTVILTAPLIKAVVEPNRSDFTPQALDLFKFVRLLPVADEIISDLNQTFPQKTAFPYGKAPIEDEAAKQWSEQYLKKVNPAKLIEADNKAFALIRAMNRLGAEERAQMLRKAACNASPTAVAAYARYYDAEQVKAFALNRSKFPQAQSIQPDVSSPFASQKMGFSQEVFDNTVEKLPPSFIGNNVNLMMTKPISNAKKDEFERTDVYTRRINAAVAQAIGLKGEWKDNSMFATILDTIQRDTEYNADKEEMSIYSALGTDERKLLGGSELEMLSENVRQFPHEISSGGSGYYAYHNETTGTFKIKMSPEEAKEAKPHLSVLILFRLNHFGYDRKGWDVFTPTVTEIWAFNSQTGEIYEKMISP